MSAGWHFTVSDINLGKDTCTFARGETRRFFFWRPFFFRDAVLSRRGRPVAGFGKPVAHAGASCEHVSRSASHARHFPSSAPGVQVHLHIAPTGLATAATRRPTGATTILRVSVRLVRNSARRARIFQGARRRGLRFRGMRL